MNWFIKINLLNENTGLGKKLDFAKKVEISLLTN